MAPGHDGWHEMASGERWLDPSKNGGLDLGGPPPRDLPGDLAVLRSVGAMRKWNGHTWAWTGKTWTLPRRGDR